MAVVIFPTSLRALISKNVFAATPFVEATYIRRREEGAAQAGFSAMSLWPAASFDLRLSVQVRQPLDCWSLCRVLR
jgi:hypothetical protein